MRAQRRLTPAADEAAEKVFVTAFRIGSWIVEPDTHRIRRDDGSCEALEPRVMALLVELAVTPMEVRDRSSLLDAVWPDVEVSDESLTVAISELRRALGDDSRRPHYVETIRKRGYRLAVAPEPVSRQTPAASGTATLSHRRRSRRLALAAAVVAGFAVVVVLSIAAWREPPPVAPSPVRPVTSFPGSEFHPELAPDGLTVAFGRYEPGVDGTDLWLVPVDDPRPRRLTSLPGFEYRPRFSADGTLVAFAWVEHHDRTGAARIGTVAVTDGEVRWLAELGSSAVALAWAEGGRVLLVVTSKSEPGQVLVVPAAGGGPFGVTLPGVPQLGALVATPAGDEVAFTTAVPGGQEVWLTAWPEVAPRQLTRRLRRIEGLAFAPGGDELVVAAAPERRFHLWAVGTGGEPARRIHPRIENVFEPDVGPGGSIVAEQFVMACDVWRVPLSAAGAVTLQPLVVAPSTLRDTAPAPSPDGRRVALVSERAGQMAPWILDQGSDGLGRPLTMPDGVVDRLRWFPDGARLLVSLEVVDGVDLVEIDADSGAVARRVRWRGESLQLGAVTPDGAAVVVVDGAARVVHEVALASGAVRLVGGPADGILALLPGRRTVVVSDGATLRRLPLDGGEAETMAAPPGVVEWARAAAGGCFIVGVEPRNWAAALVRLDLCRGDVSSAGVVEDWREWLVQDPVVSADGTVLWMMRGRNRDGLDLVQIEP